MLKKSFFIILGITLGLLTKIVIKNLFPKVTGVSYVACILLSLLLIVTILNKIISSSNNKKV